ncbi:MAG: hypothetical protein DHS20C08_04080 [Rhodomicrobium sp.]|nr:MAG: hypothetical protein DHS20C08_04080 [Rhodomicrobium sp.]
MQTETTMQKSASPSQYPDPNLGRVAVNRFSNSLRRMRHFGVGLCLIAALFTLTLMGPASLQNIGKIELITTANAQAVEKSPPSSRSLGGLRKAQELAAKEAQEKQGGANLISSQTATQSGSEGLITRAKNWLRIKQIEITKSLSAYLTRFKETNDSRFALVLLGASFLYGLFHAAGPGHGKVVVSSYILANKETVRRGIILAFLSAMVQGTVAVLLVAVLALIFNATGNTIKAFGFHLTQISYLMITALGLYLLVSLAKNRWQFYLSALTPAAANIPASLPEGQHHTHGHDHHHEHDEQCGCGHSHIPESHELQGKWDLAKIISLILSVGLRPCSGALFILAFALVKGLFWVGVLSVYAMALGTAITISAVTLAAVSGRELAILPTSDSSNWQWIIADGLRFAASLVIIAFGLLLFYSTLGPVRPF